MSSAPSLVRPVFNWWTPDPLSKSEATSPSPTTRRIYFLHPGYNTPSNVLFSLPALDRGGVHHGLALTACIIITGNRPGCLSTSSNCPNPNPPNKPVLQFDDVLTENEYYFHPEPGGMLAEAPYPVCPDFRSWLFPHRQLPKEWATLSMSAPSTSITPTAYNHNHSCRVTACSDGIQNSHIIPRDELDWFAVNSMSLYNADQRLPLSDLALDSRNTFPLRADLLAAFDDGKFVFAPKENKTVIHILTPTYELTPLYHNRLVHPLTPPGGPPREFLYARFAYSIFPLLAGFFGGGRRRVCTATARAGRDGVACLTWETEWIDWGDILRWRAGSGVGAKGAVRGVPVVTVGEVVIQEETLEDGGVDEVEEGGGEGEGEGGKTGEKDFVG